MLVFAGCDNTAGGKGGGDNSGDNTPAEQQPTGTGGSGGNPHSGGGGSTGGDDPRNAVLGTYNNVIIDGAEYTLTFYEGAYGFIKKSASSGNMRAIMPDVPAEGGYFRWALSGNTVIIRISALGDSFTLDFTNSGGTKTLSNLQPVPAATYEWDEASKTLTFKGPGEINYHWFSGLDENERALGNKVEKVVIQDGVTIIGHSAIPAMGSLKSVIIPDSVAVIWDIAFEGPMSSLKSLTLPDNTDVVSGAFWGCLELRNIIVGSGHKYFTAENGALYNKNKTKIIAWPAASGTVSIPSTVTDIGDHAFSGSMSLTSVIIPNTVKEIGYLVFNQCFGLSSVTIPNSVTSIGPSAFNECSSLTSVIIPGSVREIGDGAFVQCWKLASITIKAMTPPNLGTDVFKGGRVERKIYVPSSSVSAYKSAAGWSEYADIIEPIPAS